MATNIKIVCGANAGDEGKGLMTDYFCHRANARNEITTVVLYNGGAQRGHTVTTPDGKRHVFHHFGSGTFAGADTYLSSDFILNPMVFREEWEELVKLGYNPVVYVNDDCRVTVPYDMFINQIVEESRSSNRHGSCGMGIFETIERYKEYYYSHPIGVLRYCTRNSLRKILLRIRDGYLSRRLHEFGIERRDIPESWKNIIYDSRLIARYIDDFGFMINRIVCIDDSILKCYENIVFEGGQGLLLDQNNTEYFPHLTPSNTGVKNPYEIISDRFPDANIEVCYVTRTYLTRHGAGRLDGECRKEEINPDMVDMTNIPNPHQGTLRYAKLDPESFIERVLNDFKQMDGLDAKLSIAITHCNEFEPDRDLISRGLRDCKVYVSDGMTRDRVKILKDEYEYRKRKRNNSKGLAIFV